MRLGAYDAALESDGCRDPYQREAGMDLRSRKEITARFTAYVGELTKVIGHADRNGPLRDYCAGLLATEGRRSVEPMAAVTDPGRVSAQHQKLLHFVANSPWSDERVLAKVCELVVPVDDAACPDQSLDHRRYRVSQERRAFGRGASSVLRTARQAGQLPGGGDAVDRQPSCQSSDRLSALSAARVERRRGPPQRGSCSSRDQVQDQADDY